MKYYRDLEDYAAAYRIAREDWAADPSLVWPKNAIAWLLIKIMKIDAKAYAKDMFLERLEEFNHLGIPEGDKKLWGAVAWPIRDIVQDGYKMQWFTAGFGDKLFAIMRPMPFDKPSESYSAMLKAFIPLGGLWPHLADFIEWWGLCNFTPLDYRRFPEGGELESLVERACSAYLEALHREGGLREPSRDFYEALDKLTIRSRNQAERVCMIMNYGK